MALASRVHQSSGDSPVSTSEGQEAAKGAGRTQKGRPNTVPSPKPQTRRDLRGPPEKGTAQFHSSNDCANKTRRPRSRAPRGQRPRTGPGPPMPPPSCTRRGLGCSRCRLFRGPRRGWAVRPGASTPSSAPFPPAPSLPPPAPRVMPKAEEAAGHRPTARLSRSSPPPPRYWTVPRPGAAASSPAPPPPPRNTFGPTEGQNEQWREANRRR